MNMLRIFSFNSDNGMVDNSDAESGHQQDLANEDVQGIIHGHSLLCDMFE